MHIADVKGNNYIKLNGGVSNAHMNGAGNTFGKEEIKDDKSAVYITKNSGGYNSGETVITIEGNSVSTVNSGWTGVFFG